MTSWPTNRQRTVRISAGTDVGARHTAVLIARIGNFVRLRRELGRAAAGRIADEMVVRIDALLSPDRLLVAARDTVELVLAEITPADVDVAMAAIVQLFAAPIACDEAEVVIDVVLGGAVANGEDELRLIEEAEAALADAVRLGTPSIRILDEEGSTFDRIALSRDLVTAMRDGELLLHYQPKVHLRHRQVVSVEALLRWQHPTRGLISPGDFIPLAEESGDIAALTLWTLHRVVDDQRVMADFGHDMRVFVNIAGVLLGDERFVARACELIGEAGVPIGFEITETSVISDPESAIANLHRFAAIGIYIAIDDYGAGLSSLAYLKRLPARELKIDKLFVTQLTSSHRDPLIVRSTIDLAHALEMEVVAEGVETSSTVALLSVMGCDMAQGFFISRPVVLNSLIAFLDQNREQWVAASPASPFAMLARRA